jgi:hypothetical protein
MMDERTASKFYSLISLISVCSFFVFLICGVGFYSVIRQLHDNAQHLHKEIEDLRAQLAWTFTPENGEDGYYGFPMRTALAVEAISKQLSANIPNPRKDDQALSLYAELTRSENELTAIRAIMIKQKQGPDQTA